MKRCALPLLAAFVILSLYMPSRIGAHLLKHAQGTHATQHRSLICTWMCMVSSFAPTTILHLVQALRPSAALPRLDPQAEQKISISPPLIRGPPAFL